MWNFRYDVGEQCNKLLDEAVSVAELNIRLCRDLSIDVSWITCDGYPAEVNFPVAMPTPTPEMHRQVFSTIATILEETEGSDGIIVNVFLSTGSHECNDTHTAEMALFLQSIVRTSTIQQTVIAVNPCDSPNGRVMDTHCNNATGPTDDFQLVTAIVTNLALPQSIVEKLTLQKIHLDHELLATLCGPISKRQCLLVKLKLQECQYLALGLLWRALAENKSIENLVLCHLGSNQLSLDDWYGPQELQSMLETNTTMTDLSLVGVGSWFFPNSFYTALGAGLASNTTLNMLDLSGATPGYDEYYVAALFEGGLDRHIGLEKFCLEVSDWVATQEFVLGMDRMAKNISTQHSVDGSHRVSKLNNLLLCFSWEGMFVDCADLTLDCFVRNSACFALGEFHLDSRKDHEEEPPLLDAYHFAKLAAFIQAFPTLTILTVFTSRDAIDDDSHLKVLADTLENNTTMTWLEIGRFASIIAFFWVGNWSLADKPNWTHTMCSIVQNKRELPVFWESNKRNLVPLALATLLKPGSSDLENVVNLTHAFRLVQNLPDLFSTDGGSGGEKVESVES